MEEIADTMPFMIDPTTRIGPVTLKVSDLTTQTTFYREVVGLHLLAEGDHRVVLGVSERPLLYLQHTPEGRFVHGTTGLYHLALRVPTRSELGHWFKHYTTSGAPNWQGASDHGVSHALYLSDLEGNGIEVYSDLPNNTWQVFENGRIEIYTRHLDLRALLDDAPSSDWVGLPDGTDMGHIHLKVADTEEARDFYVGILGFEIKAEFPGSALFIAAGFYHHHIGLNSWESAGALPPPESAYGLDSYTILVKNSLERDRLLERLRESGYLFEDKPDPEIRDPSGNRLTLKLSTSL